MCLFLMQQQKNIFPHFTTFSLYIKQGHCFMIVFFVILAQLCGLVSPLAVRDPDGVVRGPLLHEHSFQAPLVSDWWSEGVPHFMIGGSAIANEKFIRLTTNNLDDHGFAFNTAPMDHENWEIRMKFSIRPPPPALQGEETSSTTGHYQGGDGLALWYIDQPIGDDHQHVLKYSKPITAELDLELKDKENPWRMLDTILSDNYEVNIYEGIPEEYLTDKEKAEIRMTEQRNELKHRKREELFRRLFKRGTSIDDSDYEPRIMGVKHSDFTNGFAIVLDSVGDEHTGEKEAHHHHKASISLLLNLPDHKHNSGKTVLNNVHLSRSTFRQFPQVLHCEYDFRQAGSKPFKSGDKIPTARNMDAPEEPAELIVRYYNKKLSIAIVREDVSKREPHGSGDGAEVAHTYSETLCGEVYPVDIPLKYHFGLSASTGHRRKRDRKNENTSAFQADGIDALTHVDVHDVYSFSLRELGTDPKAMGYSKTIPLEHFNYEGDRRERLHYSRQIPVEPDSE